MTTKNSCRGKKGGKHGLNNIPLHEFLMFKGTKTSALKIETDSGAP